MVIQARAEATRQSILDAAVSLFDEVEYGKAGLADIMNRAGVTKGGFYYHFPTKEALAAAIIEEAAAEIRTTFHTIIDSSPAPALAVSAARSAVPDRPATPQCARAERPVRRR